ncbi:hypothetical protein N406_00750 [Helicobacter pylori FD577]|nr:hypothetical protein N406_00750 [Helicobacter pylori FD577]
MKLYLQCVKLCHKFIEFLIKLSKNQEILLFFWI